MYRGYIKLWRKTTEWGWYKKPHMFHLFQHLIMSANNKDAEWQGILVKRGQLITGLHSLHKNTGISTQSIRTCLEKLKSTNEITIKSTNKFSIITIVKYEDYQPDKEKLTSKSTSKLTNNQQTTNKQLTTNKNDKNDKNEEEYIAETSSAFDYVIELNKLLNDKQQHIRIIGYYWQYKGIIKDNKDQLSSGIKRDARAAISLKGYDLNKIKEVMFWLNGQDWIDWTLETVHKYIDKNLNELNKKYE